MYGYHLDTIEVCLVCFVEIRSNGKVMPTPYIIESLLSDCIIGGAWTLGVKRSVRFAERVQSVDF